MFIPAKIIGNGYPKVIFALLTRDKAEPLIVKIGQNCASEYWSWLSVFYILKNEVKVCCCLTSP